MESRFITFRPQTAVLQPWISYYYLDQKPGNNFHAYRCFPHLNTSLSLYESHLTEGIGKVRYAPGTGPLQIYSPIRQEILEVQQTGPVNRIVVVFPPCGIQQFFQHQDWSSYHFNPPFLTESEIKPLFSYHTVEELNTAVDQIFLRRLRVSTPTTLLEALSHIQNAETSIAHLAEALGMSRRHLSRLFQTHLGISPKRYREIGIFRQFLDLKRNKFPEEKLISLALDLGLTDASHLHKLVKKFTELAPTSFLEKGQNLGNEDIFWHQVPNIHSK